MPITPTPKIWMNGSLVDWDDARIHVLTHSLHYGMGVFEGIRAYATADGPAVFRLTEHIERLHKSAQILGMPLEYSVADLIQATKDTVASTGLDACYIRPIAYFGYGEMGLNTLPCTVDVSIACWPWGAYLGDDAVEKGIRLKTSSWTRHRSTQARICTTIGAATAVRWASRSSSGSVIAVRSVMNRSRMRPRASKAAMCSLRASKTYLRPCDQHPARSTPGIEATPL